MNRSALVIAAILISAVVWVTTPYSEISAGLDGDGKHYLALSQAFAAGDFSSSRNTAPWCWRILTPALASILPWSPERSLYLLALLSAPISLILLGLLLLRIGFVLPFALVGVMLYAGVFWSIKFPLYSPFYIDHQSMVFELLVLHAIFAGAPRVTSVVLTAAVLQRESALFLLPLALYTFLPRQSVPCKRGRLSLLLTLPPLIAIGVVRLLIQAQNAYSPEAALIQTLLVQVSRLDVWLALPREIFSGTGVLIPLAAISLLHPWKQELMPWWILIAAGCVVLFGGWDKGRLFLFMLPGLVVLALEALRRLHATAPHRAFLFIGLTLLVQLYLGHHFTPLGNHADYLQTLVPLHATEGAGANLLCSYWAFCLWVVAALTMALPWKLTPRSQSL